MTEDLIKLEVLVLKLNYSVADECNINPDVKKWTSMSEGSDNFAID